MAENDETRIGPPEAPDASDAVAGSVDRAPASVSDPPVDTDEAASPPDEPPNLSADATQETDAAVGEESTDRDEPRVSEPGESSGTEDSSGPSPEGRPREGLGESVPPSYPAVEVSEARTLSGEIDAAWIDSSEPVVHCPQGLAGVGAGIGRNMPVPELGRPLPRPSQVGKLAPSRASAEHAIELPLVESRRREPTRPGSVDEAIELLESTNARTREALADLLRVMDQARAATEKSTAATESVAGLLRSERHTRLVEAAQRVHSENEVAVLTEERDRLRSELADARAGGQATEALSEQIRELNERHAAELVRRQEALEAEHEQLQIQSEDRQRLNEELDALHQALEEKTRRIAQLEATAADSQGSAGQLEAVEQERDELRGERDAAREHEARLQVEAEATRRATQLNVAEQKRLREELESQRSAVQEASEEAARLRERLEAGEVSETSELATERDRLLVERDELQAAKAQLEADLANERRSLETALVDREFVDAEVAEWRAKAEDEARRCRELEAEQTELRETRAQLQAKLSELHQTGEQLDGLAQQPEDEAPADLDDAGLLPGAIRGLALPGDEATRDDLVERLLQAKQQIDVLLQERAQTRVKLRLLEAQAKQS